MEKREIRHLVTERKKEYTDSQLEQMSRKIIARIRELPAYQEAETVFAYMDLPGEVRMRDLIQCCWKDGKITAVPKIVPAQAKDSARTENGVQTKTEREMRFYRIGSFQDLREGTMHIMEPDADRCQCLDTEEQALIIMPGVAFDSARNRIGYGGGFYDLYLARHPGHPTVAAAYSFQIFDRIPAAEHDIRPQVVVTEEEVF